MHSITLPDCSMPPMEADTTYQGCLPSCKLHMHSRSLTVRCTSKVESLYIAHSNHTIFRLHMCTNKSYCRSCVSCGGAPTPAGTSMFTMWKICTHMKCEVKHNGDMGMGHLWLIMGGAFMAYNGWGSYDKVSCCFVRLPWLHNIPVSLPFHVAMKQAWFTLIQAWNRNTYTNILYTITFAPQKFCRCNKQLLFICF